MIGSDMGEGAFHGGIESGSDEGMLEPVTVRAVVMDIVGGYESTPRSRASLTDCRTSSASP